MSGGTNPNDFPENGRSLQINIGVNIPGDGNPPDRSVTFENIEVDQGRLLFAENRREIRAPDTENNHGGLPGNQNTANQFGAVRDRLFHAMLVRIALRYSSRVKLFARRLIECVVLFSALCLLSVLLFVHIKFTRSSSTCLDTIQPEWIRDGVVRVEVVRNLKTLEEQEDYIKKYVSDKSSRTCRFRVKDVFFHGPQVVPAEIRSQGWSLRMQNNTPIPQKRVMSQMAMLGYFMSSPIDFLFGSRNITIYEYLEELERKSFEDINEKKYDEMEDPYIEEAQRAWKHHFRMNYEEDDTFEYMYRVEYALLYGVLRLPPTYREKHGIPTRTVRIDAKSKCFGDAASRFMMRSVVGYEDAIIAALRKHAIEVTGRETSSNSMGYLHDLQTHEHYHFVSNVLGKTSYITAAILMLIFTFAISMLLRFSHHQIFIFIIDLLHMFELQQPLSFPVAPIFTVILALVGMEAIMSEVFNDTSTAFYVILIVWVADQYDAICCHSQVSKKYWLRFFYVYQFFFYAYQYRFGGQYGTLALWTSATFILHSMIYFFHHYEMPLILYQDRVQQVLADLHAPQDGMTTVEVQTITVPPRSTSRTSVESNATATTTSTANLDAPLSPSSVFDARGPSLEEADMVHYPSTSLSQIEPTLPEEIVASRIVNDAMNELFNSE